MPNGYMQGTNDELIEIIDAYARECLSKKLPAPATAKVGDYLRIEAVNEDGTYTVEAVPEPTGGGELPSTAKFETLAIGAADADGVYIQSDGTAEAPTLDLYGEHGDEPVRLRNLAEAVDDSDAPTLAQVRALMTSLETIKLAVVSELPQTGEAKTLYLVPSANEADLYAEYLYINGAWEIVGSQRLDLTGYATEEWVKDYVGEHSGENVSITVDAEMSDESENPVQNKVVKAYVDALPVPKYGYLKGLRYAAWGDSIVHMQGSLTNPLTFAQASDKYTTDLQGRDISGITVEGYVTAIERRYGLVAENYGQGGHTIVGDYSSIVGMDYSDVALVTIAYGVNDARSGVPLGTVNSVDPTTFAGALNLILKKIYNDNPECRVLVLTPIQRLYVSDFGIATPNANGNYLIDFCRMCEKVAAKRSTACINMYEQCGINQTNLYYYTVEGVHPVNQGFARMTNAVIPVLDGLFSVPYDPIGSMTNSGDEEPDEPETDDGTEETPEEDPVGEAIDLTDLFVYDGIIYDCYVAEPNVIGSDSYNASSSIVCTGPIELTSGKVYTAVSYLSSVGVYFGLVNGSADRRILDEETGEYTSNRVNDVVLKNDGLQIYDVVQSVTEVEIDGVTYRKLTATIAPTTTRYLWLGGLRSMQDQITLTVV